MLEPTDVLPLQEFAKKHLGLPTLRVFLDGRIHSGIQDHRVLLRQHLMETLKQSFPQIPANLLAKVGIPGEVLPLQSVHFSISHSPQAGGYAVADSGAPLGFDIEDTSRVSPRISQRIRHADDLPKAQASVHFWAAKEAAFKSFFMNESSTLSQIAITSWDETSNGISFRAQTAHASGNGVVSRIHALSISIFLKVSSFSR
jgi:phosphopantetheinyl transferase (holo-ACP synthase)